jgi:Serine carboxypeptidase S28
MSFITGGTFSLCIVIVICCIRQSISAIPTKPQFYHEQKVDHLSNSSDRQWTQRYYTSDRYFDGPGFPIFVIFGGEGAIEPSTGLFYPFVVETLASRFRAFVLQPEHRFYGASQPIPRAEIEYSQQKGYSDPRITLLTYEQALYDYMRLTQSIQAEWGCSCDRTSPEYCPVVTVGGSYPGFLSAMARIIFPHIVDMAYAASAPMKFYAQQVPDFAYYEHITKVADAALPGCSRGVQESLYEIQQLFQSGTAPPSFDIGICPGSIPSYCMVDGNIDTEMFLNEVFMMVAYTFANANMAYYPPSNHTMLYQLCQIFADDSTTAVSKLRQFFLTSLSPRNSTSSCICMMQEVPYGTNATISAGDWSGVGTGTSGDSWDFQTCTLNVEAIGFNSSRSMFLDRPWSYHWLSEHCRNRFRGVTPQPYAINERWQIDNLTAISGLTNILFTNGLRDGWSVSGIQQNISDAVIAMNFPNGAHHSDLSGKVPSKNDTDDIQKGFLQIQSILAAWLQRLSGGKHSHSHIQQVSTFTVIS